MITVKKLISEQGMLTNETINEWSEKAVSAYKTYAKKRAVETVKLGLTVEEILLRIRDTYGEEENCKFIASVKGGNVVYDFIYHGVSVDCLKVGDDMQSSYDILARMGEKPQYGYSPKNGGTNTVTYSYKKKPVKNKMLIEIGIAVLAAVLFSFVLGHTGPVGTTISDVLLGVVFPKTIAVLTAVSTPLVFLAVIGGITGLGDMSSFGKIGSTLLKNMMITYFVCSAVLCGVSALFYPVTSGIQAEGESVAESLTKLVLDIIPDNLAQPFINDNALQVITLAVFMGIVLLLMGDKVKGVNAILVEITDFINKMMSIVIKIIPFIVFLGIMKLLEVIDGDTIKSMASMFAIYFICMIAGLLYMVIRLKRRVKTPLKTIIKYMLPTFIINITTSSQISALPENMICCKEKFKINEKMVDFGIPFGLVTYMPMGAMMLGLTVFGLAAIYNIPITVVMIVKVFLLSVVVAIAAPPIPGSAFIVLPIMLSSCGISSEHLPFAIVFGTIIGYICPALNGIVLQLEMLISAKQLENTELE